MDSDRGIDWYSVSKMSCQNIELYKFNEIISVLHPEQNIDRVSLQYRKKLLMMFQKASQKIKQQTPHLLASYHQLQIKRNFVSDQLSQLESEAETKFKQFTNLKFILNQKKRLKGKLKQKLQKKGIHQGKKVYCCAICNRQDFQTIDAYKTHMFIQHRETNQKFNQSSQQMNELKDLLMTMKDKQIEMMSMFLRASKELQTQKLEKQYDKEYNKFMQISNTKTDESKEQQELVELKGESQFLFFRKSQQFRREMQQDQDFRRRISKQKALKKESLHQQFYQPGNYYNVFGSIAENKSQRIQEQSSPQKNEDSANKSSYYDPNEIISKFLKQHESFSRDSRFSLVQNTPKPKIQFKEQKTLRQNQYIAPSISDRLRLINKQNQKPNPQYETMFSTKRKFYQENGYIFNSGPLMDDKGGDSDYQDYFGKNKNLNISIQDQEIKLTFANLNKSNLPASKESFHFSKLLSPKDNSSNSLFMDKESKQKSSVIVDLSDSFSKRDFQISKDDQTINLSDLKFSKLERKKQQEKLNKYKSQDIIEEIKDANSRQTYSNNKQIVKKPLLKNNFPEKTEIQILKEYEKPIITPLREQNYRFTEQGSYTKNFIKINERTNVLNINRNNLNNENSIGLLNEFLKDQYKGERKSSIQKKQPTKSRELDQFIQK